MMKTKDAVAVVARALRKADKPNLAETIEDALTPKPPKTALDLLRDYEQLMAAKPGRPPIDREGREAWREHMGRMNGWRSAVRLLVAKDDARACTHQRASYSRSCLCGKRKF